MMHFSVMTVSKSVASQCSRYALEYKTFISDTNRYLSSTPCRHVFWAPTNFLLNYYLQKLHVNVNKSGMNLVTLGTSNQCLGQKCVDLNLHSPSISTHLSWCFIINRDKMFLLSCRFLQLGEKLLLESLQKIISYVAQEYVYMESFSVRLISCRPRGEHEEPGSQFRSV